jgi:hypothetical protein
MMITQRDSMPKMANLRACKQWWKVCFLHGDQQKYYRQIYGHAASQRLANYQNNNNSNNTNDKNSKIIFPIKFYSANDTQRIQKSSDTISKDPFLATENGSDSGIDANCAAKSEATNDT